MNPSPPVSPVRRRTFLKGAAMSLAALALPERLLADPYAPVREPQPPGAPVRIRGRVHSGGRGVRGVAVSDGVTVAATDADGRYEIVSTDSQPFVFVSLPAGYAIPTSASSTARFYQPIRAGSAGDMDAVFEFERLRESDADHTFFVLADPQTQNMTEVGMLHAETVPDVRAVVNSLGGRHAFGVACGDIMFDDLALFPEWERAALSMGVPFFQVVGNHDIVFDERTDEASNRTFERHFGPAYYSFDRGAVHYVVLDDVFWHGAGYLGYVDDRQLRWLAADLARVERGRPVVVFLHIPALSTRGLRSGEREPGVGESIANRQALYRLLEPYAAHVMSGHTHEHEHVFDGGVHGHVHGTVCGAWWSGPICWDGTPNGYSIYDARGEELRWRHKSTGLEASHQIRAYGHGADGGAPDEVVANVWGWDPEWRVVWYEDGERRGAMARRTGLDPLSVRLHAGAELPPRRRWVEPTRTDHLFYAPASRAAKEIKIEATDRWGGVYTAVVPREMGASGGK
jgi:hypothetical protein